MVLSAASSGSDASSRGEGSLLAESGARAKPGAEVVGTGAERLPEGPKPGADALRWVKTSLALAAPPTMAPRAALLRWHGSACLEGTHGSVRLKEVVQGLS